MKEEIAAAVFFVARLVKRYGCLDNDSRDRFAAALTVALFENYKYHWHPNAPSKGQAYRCLRMNRMQLRDSVLLQACERSTVRYEDMGLPQEMTLWVDPGEVSCRYGEHSTPFCVSVVPGGRRGDGEFSRRIHEAVERASLDVQSGSSSEEEEADNSMSSGSSSLAPCPFPVPPPSSEPKTIPTISNPNSVYRFSEFSPAAPQNWLREKKRKELFPPLPPPHHPPPNLPPPPPPLHQLPPPTVIPSNQFSGQKFKPYRATASFTFTGPRVDKYHWVSKSRS